VVKLFSSSDRNTRVKLLQQIDQFIEHIQTQVVNDKIFPNIVSGFMDTNPVVRESTIKAMLFIAPKLNYKNLNEELMPNLEGIIVLNTFELVVSRSEKLSYAHEHLNALYGKKYPRNFRPHDISYRKDSPEELAVINYTSGTTGFSKGVMLPYRSLTSNVEYCWEKHPIGPGDNLVGILPMGHIFGMVYDFLYGICAGAHVYYLTRMPSPKIIAQSFSEIKPKLISCVPLIVEKIIKKK
jgi:long-chain acyl-CoA synthetase